MTQLSPNMLLSRATQMAADSIGATDQQIAATRSIGVNANVVPQLAQDYGLLQNELAHWPNYLRPLAIKVLQQALQVDTAAIQSWGRIDKDNQAALMAYAANLRESVKIGADGITQLQNALAPFRSVIDNSVSTLRMDLTAVSNQLNTERMLVNMLQQQAQQQQDRVNYYRSHPWRLIVDGLTIYRLIEDLNDIHNSQNRANAAISQMQQLYPQIQQLSDARGPLLGLSTAVACLGGGVSNMQTAVAQINNKLGDMMQQKLFPVIMAAQLAAIIDDLNGTDAIVKEMLAGS